MRAVSLKTTAKALTLIEVLLVIAVIGVLLLLALPTLDGRPTRAPSAQCSNNLRQIGLRLLMFAGDHGDQFPPRASITNGGSMEFVGRGSPAAHFQALTNDTTLYFKMWICPTDKKKNPATNYVAFDDHNVSYFLSMDAAPTPVNAQFISLAGDRHLEFAGQPVRPGLFTLTTNAPVGWTRELHGNTSQSPGGFVLFVDGHVEFRRHKKGVVAVQHQGLATNLLAVP